MGRIALMARENNRLSAIGLANKKPGFHPDGRGLYLSVNPSGSRSWILRYMLRGRSRDMGLGSFPDISLAEARNAATNARALQGRHRPYRATRQPARSPAHREGPLGFVRGIHHAIFPS